MADSSLGMISRIRALPWLLLAVIAVLTVTDRCNLDRKRIAAIAERDDYMAKYRQNETALKAELDRDKASYAAQVTKIVTLENRIKELLKPRPQPVGNPDQLPQTEPSSDHLQLPPLEGLSFADALGNSAGGLLGFPAGFATGFSKYIERNVQAREDHEKIVTDYEDLLSIKDGVIRDLYQTTNKLADLGKRRICLTIGPCVYVGSNGVGFGVSLQLGYRIW